ncbi:MAG: hypothetical protein WA734_11725 [Candidatus Acidiferrales bacterium]
MWITKKTKGGNYHVNYDPPSVGEHRFRPLVKLASTPHVRVTENRGATPNHKMTPKTTDTVQKATSNLALGP